VAYAENFDGGGSFIQWHMVVIRTLFGVRCL